MPPHRAKSLELFRLDGDHRRAVDTAIRNYARKIVIGEKYYDDEYEYRTMTLHQDLGPYVPDRLMTPEEVACFGVQQSPGWEHFMIHGPERHILIFRRPLSHPNSQGAPPPHQTVPRAHLAYM
eukprot:PhM_4_TR6247/c0_g1_i1/m.98550/K02219/CKS1; cyclin-dependent kinase regulatory subunit CKS1